MVVDVGAEPATREQIDALPICVAEFKNKSDNQPRLSTWPWHRLIERLHKHEEWQDKDGSLWSPTKYKPGTTRANENVLALYAGCLDFDHGLTTAEVIERLQVAGVEAVVHSTWQYEPETCERCRAIIPFAYPVPGADWRREKDIRARLTHSFGASTTDERTDHEAALFYLPSHKPGALHFVKHIEGKLLDPYTLPGVRAGAGTAGPFRTPAAPIGGTIPYGKQHATLVSIAGSMRGRGLDADEIDAALQVVNEQRCQKPGPRENIRKIAESVCRYAPGEIVPVSVVVREIAANWAQEEDDWPEPLDEAAFYGLAGRYVRMVEPHTEADPVALLVQFLVFFGSAVGRAPYYRVEADQHRVNLFGVLVGATAKGRKGTSAGHIKSLFASVDQIWAESRLVSGLSSGEGLTYAVRDQMESQEPIKEKGRVVDYQTVVTDPGVKDKRLTVLESEFASTLRVMGREGNTLSAVVRQAWDDGMLRALTRNSPVKATGAHISIIGHITKDELLRYLESTEAANGFANRYIWACVRRSKCLPEGGQLQTVDFAPIVRDLQESLQFARTKAEIKKDDEARELWAAVYPELSEGKPGMFGAVTSRGEAQVTRLALIYALLDRSPLIRKEHLLAALALWEYCEASARWIFGDALGDPLADQVLKMLRQAPEKTMSRSEISKALGKNRSAAEISRALQALATLHLARCERDKPDPDNPGRPTEWWIAER